MTNEEMIKTMSTEELAFEIAKIAKCRVCPAGFQCSETQSCYDNIKKWLMQEAKV